MIVALNGMARVLKSGGRLLFAEQGATPESGVRRWQDRMNGAWSCIAGGCNLNRVIPDLIRAGGFRIERLESGYLPGPKPLSFEYWGSARVA